jgi:hypothetical protein
MRHFVVILKSEKDLRTLLNMSVSLNLLFSADQLKKRSLAITLKKSQNSNPINLLLITFT